MLHSTFPLDHHQQWSAKVYTYYKKHVKTYSASTLRSDYTHVTAHHMETRYSTKNVRNSAHPDQSCTKICYVTVKSTTGTLVMTRTWGNAIKTSKTWGSKSVFSVMQFSCKCLAQRQKFTSQLMSSSLVSSACHLTVNKANGISMPRAHENESLKTFTLINKSWLWKVAPTS